MDAFRQFMNLTNALADLTRVRVLLALRLPDYRTLPPAMRQAGPRGMNG